MSKKQIQSHETTIAKEVDSNDRFINMLLRLNAAACDITDSNDFDMEKGVKDSDEALKALSSTTNLQKMIAAQMLSIHRLQQISAFSAHKSEFLSNKQYYINASIKLANCFTQQANLLARLQGDGIQKIIVERVDVHGGGQAIVGNINGVSPKK